MVNSFIAQKDLDSEMTVVRNEFERGENDPSSVLEERVFSTAFLWHNYGHSTIGARSDIEHVPIDRLQAFYHRYYQPDNAVLLVAGKFDEPRTLAAVQDAFGAIPAPSRQLPRIYTEEPAQDGERSVTLRRDRRRRRGARRLSHPRGVASRLLRRSTFSCASWPTRRRAASIRPWSTRRRRRGSAAFSISSAIPGTGSSPPTRARTSRSTMRRT